MRAHLAVGLATLVAACASERKYSDLSLFAELEAIPAEQYVEAAGLRFRLTKDFLDDRMTAYHVKRDELVNFLSSLANQKEFSVAYLPKQELLVNTTLLRAVISVEHDKQMLDALMSSGEEFYLIHNHNNMELNPEKDKNPLYWLAPPHSDIFSYMFMGSKSQQMKYGIISQYGMLFLATDSDTFRYMGNPLFGKAIKAEAQHIMDSLIGVKTENLQKWANEYRGILRLSFEMATILINERPKASL